MSEPKEGKEVLKPLPGSCTKTEMLEWLQKSDTPDDAELTIGYQEGKFILWWRWSYLAGAFGDDFVYFGKAESDCLKREMKYDE